MKKESSKQSRADRLLCNIRNEESRLRARIHLLEKRKNKLYAITKSLDDPHALIPQKYYTLEQWLDGHPYPDTVLSHIYPNYAIACEVSYSCYIYQYDYHVVKCKPKEYYKEHISLGRAL